jgi:hypothetical protein
MRTGVKTKASPLIVSRHAATVAEMSNPDSLELSLTHSGNRMTAATSSR